MIVTLKDGSKKEYSEAMSVIDIAKDISEGLARNACAGEIASLDTNMYNALFVPVLYKKTPC